MLRVLTALTLSTLVAIPQVTRANNETAPLSLSQAIQIARRENPNARIALQQIESAEALLRQSRAAHLPRFDLAVSYRWTDQPAVAFASILNTESFSPTLNFNDVPSVDNLNLSGQMQLSLYAGGADQAKRRAAAFGVQASKAQRQAVELGLTFEVIRAYIQVARSWHLLQAAESAVASYRNNAKVADARHRGGTLLKTDLLDVGVRLARAEHDLIRATHGLKLARQALGLLLGGRAVSPGAIRELPQLSPPRSKTIDARPELHASDARVKQLERVKRAQQAGYLPQVQLVGQVDFDHGFRRESSGFSYLVGLVGRWNIFSGLATREQVRQAAIGISQAAEQKRKQQLVLQYQLARAQSAFEQAKPRLTLAQRAITQAEQSAALTRARFAQGLAISSQLIDSETALTAARVQLVEAQADQTLAIAMLYHSTGSDPLAALKHSEEAK